MDSPSHTAPCMTKSPPIRSTVAVELKPINLHDRDEFVQLTDQRKRCGWNFEPSKLQSWRDQIDRGLKVLFWIVLTDHHHDDQNATTKVGHVGLARTVDPPDPDLAREDGTVLNINTFFISPHHRAGGVGRRVMDLLESIAIREPYGSLHCTALAVDTLSHKYYDPRGPWWDDSRVGRFSIQPWYERRGYVVFKEEPRYLGSDGVLMDAVLMRKVLK